MMLPPEFVERIDTQSYMDSGSLFLALSAGGSVSVRVNRRKWPYQVTGYEQVGWEPDGYYLPFRPLFTADPLFHAGVYYPQESSSMFLGEMFRQLAGERRGLRVLDLCGAPGGKSTHLSSLIGDEGLLVANEIIRSRAAVLAENITKWGMGNVMVTSADPSRFAALPGFFDVVVADAPCSGEGMFRSAAAVSEWSVANTMLCRDRQRRIVMDAWPALKAGGVFIYSTCTFNPAENEENLAWFSAATGSESLTLSLPPSSPVVTLSYGGVTGYGFHPGRIRGDGFFIAALRKPERSLASDEGPRGVSAVSSPHPGRKAGMRPSARAAEVISSYADFDPERVVMSDNRIIVLAAPDRLAGYIIDRLPVIKSGTLAGEMKKSGFVPAHDLAMSVRLRDDACPAWELTREQAISYLSHERLEGEGAPAGRVVARYRGVPVGFANNAGNRINNGYPAGWRIRMTLQRETREVLS